MKGKRAQIQRTGHRLTGGEWNDLIERAAAQGIKIGAERGPSGRPALGLFAVLSEDRDHVLGVMTDGEAMAGEARAIRKPSALRGQSGFYQVGAMIFAARGVQNSGPSAGAAWVDLNVDGVPLVASEGDVVAINPDETGPWSYSILLDAIWTKFADGDVTEPKFYLDLEEFGGSWFGFNVRENADGTGGIVDKSARSVDLRHVENGSDWIGTPEEGGKIASYWQGVRPVGPGEAEFDPGRMAAGAVHEFSEWQRDPAEAIWFSVTGPTIDFVPPLAKEEETTRPEDMVATWVGMEQDGATGYVSRDPSVPLGLIMYRRYRRVGITIWPGAPINRFAEHEFAFMARGGIPSSDPHIEIVKGPQLVPQPAANYFRFDLRAGSRITEGGIIATSKLLSRGSFGGVDPDPTEAFQFPPSQRFARHRTKFVPQ